MPVRMSDWRSIIAALLSAFPLAVLGPVRMALRPTGGSAGVHDLLALKLVCPAACVPCRVACVPQPMAWIMIPPLAAVSASVQHHRGARCARGVVRRLGVERLRGGHVWGLP